MTDDQRKVLQKFLDENKGKIPQRSKQHRTTFDIMKQPHLENVWSNIYAFYFNPKEEHNFGNLFLKSIIELIKEKNDNRGFTPMLEQIIDVKTEDGTAERKRLDIALKSDEYAILIENKVYATLYNPLNNYWKNYDYSPEKKQGVILSLYSQIIDDKYKDHWINITHSELMERISKNLSDYLLNANNKYLMFYKEFYQNITNMTKIMDSNSIEFYVKNMSSIEKIGELRNDIKKEIINRITDTLKNKGFNESYTLFNNNNLYFHKNSERGRSKQHCVISIFCREIYTERLTITIAVEVLNKTFLAECSEKLDTVGFEGCINKDALNTTKDWALIAKIAQQLTPGEFQNISGIVEDLIFNKPISEDRPSVTIFSIFEKVDNFYNTLHPKTHK